MVYTDEQIRKTIVGELSRDIRVDASEVSIGVSDGMDDLGSMFLFRF